MTHTHRTGIVCLAIGVMAGTVYLGAQANRQAGPPQRDTPAQQAAAMGVMRLYLFTNPRDLYEKLGWRAIVEEQYEGQSVTIMAIDISA